MVRILGLLLSVAAAVATLDLAQKAFSISERSGAVFTHDRSTLYVAGIAAALVWAGAVVLVRSVPIALAGGVVLGGATGNFASIALWPSLPGVPDPLVAGGIAFNVADVSILLGLAFLFPAMLVFAARNRERLFEPI